MKNKPTILWLTDGVGWGFDIRANVLSKLLPDFEHKKVIASGKREIDLVREIRKVKADIILSMNQRGLRFISKKDAEKVVVGLSSIRSLKGWKR